MIVNVYFKIAILSYKTVHISILLSNYYQKSVIKCTS